MGGCFTLDSSNEEGIGYDGLKWPLLFIYFSIFQGVILALEFCITLEFKIIFWLLCFTVLSFEPSVCLLFPVLSRSWPSSNSGRSGSNWKSPGETSLGGHSSTTEWCCTHCKTQENDGGNGEKRVGLSGRRNRRVGSFYLPAFLSLSLADLVMGTMCYLTTS